MNDLERVSIFRRAADRVSKSSRRAERTKSSKRIRRGRVCHYEQLEARRLLTAAIWNNVLHPTDVNGRNGTSALDALLVINELQRRSFSDPATGTLQGTIDEDHRPPFFDVNCDTRVSALDALLVINSLARPGDEPAYSFATGSPLHSDGGEGVAGSVTAVGCHPRLSEGDSLRTELSRTVTLTEELRGIRMLFDAPQFDLATAGAMQDAFEVHLTDDDGNLLIAPFEPGRTVAFNWSESSQPAGGTETRFTIPQEPSDEPYGLFFNLSHLDAGTDVTVTARLVNNDSDNQTSVVIRDVGLVAASDEAAPNFAAQRLAPDPGDPVRWDRLEDLTASILPSYGRTSYTADRSQIITELVVTNIGNQTIIGDLLVALDGFSQIDTFVTHPDGLMADGRPYFRLTGFADAPLEPGQSTQPRVVRFTNPQEQRFDYRLTAFGDLNVAPRAFLSTPVTEIEAGRTFRYNAEAIDDDGHQLTYSVVTGPASMTIDGISGELTWPTLQGDLGGHSVTLRATDPYGLSVEQSFMIEVFQSLQNRPPRFVSDPVTEAIASSGFEISTVAVGPSPADVAVISGFRGPRLVSANAGDQTIRVHAGQNRDRFDDETIYSTGEPRPTGAAIDVGYSVDVGLPPFLVPADSNDVLGMDQGDFNGDGILDLVALTKRLESTMPQGQRDTIEITRMLGDGDGNFSSPVVIATIPIVSSSRPKNLRVADIDGDGHLDVIALERTSARLITVRGIGNGEFEPAVLTTLDTPLKDFRLVDLDGDGHLDIVGRNRNVSDFGWMRGVGDGTFEPFVRLADGGAITIAATNVDFRPYDFADLNGDGHMDIVLGEYYTSGNLVVLLNDGEQNFDIALTIDPPGGYLGPQVVHVGDFTGDGELDIFTVNTNQRRVDLFVGDGSGTNFTHRPGTNVLGLAGNAAGSDGPVDVNGNGHLDIVLANPGWSEPTSPQVLINDGEGNFTRTDYPMLSFPGHASEHNQTNLDVARGAMFGDYNGDGVIDLVYMTAGNDFNGVGMRLGTRPGEFGATRTIPEATRDFSDREVHAADFDGDGIIDLLVLRSATMLLGNGDGTFADPFPAAQVSGPGDNGTIADFNLDGIPDYVAVRSGGGSRLYVGLGNGDGTFETIDGPLSGHFYNYQDIRIEDFNGDGYPDIIAKAGVEKVIDVYLNDPDSPGNFERTFAVNLQSSGTLARGYQSAFATGDFDGDGIIDFVAADQAPGEPIKLMTFTGVGDGTFELTNEVFAYDDEFFEGIYYRPNVLQSGDVNEDGFLDVVSFTSNGAVIHLGNGDGTFTTVDHYPAEAFQQDNKDGYLIDFDQDGHLDLLYYGPQQTLSLRRGFGDGTFADPQRVGMIGAGDALTFADFDNDGYLDMAMAMTFAGNYSNDDVVFYFGTRDGLVDQLAVDLNQDGNEEILAINEANDRLKLFVGDNLGGLTRQTDLLTGRAPKAVAVGDLDGDGHLQIITANRAGRSVSVFSGSVSDGYTSIEIPVGNGPVDVETADVNGDRHLDILVLDDSANALWVLTGSADGTLSDPVAIPLGDKPGRFTIADATGDGQLNAVITLPETDRVMILSGLDLQPDSPPPIYVSFDSSPGDVAVTDLNADGNPDLAVTLPSGDAVSVRYGLGGGQFAKPQRIAVGQQPTRVTLADADSDGRIDLIVTNTGDGTASVIYNRFDPNEVYRYDSDAIDPDDDPLTYSIVDGPGGLIINGETGELLWAASPDQVGAHKVTIQADDGRGGVATQSFKIDVQPARDNAAPLFATEPETTIGASETFAYQATALDRDRDPLRYRLLDAPAGATIDPTTGEVAWDPRRNLAVSFGPHGMSSTGRIEVSADPSLQPASLTAEAWFNFTTLPANNGRSNLIIQPSSGNAFAYSLSNLYNNQLRLQMDFGGGTPSFVYSVPFVPQADRWYHLALTIDDATRTATILADGVALGSTPIPAAIAYDPDARARIGEIGPYYTRAIVDNYRLWNVARTPAEIVEGMSRHYQDDSRIVLDYRFDLPDTLTVRDDSPAGNHGYRIANGLLPPLVPGLADPGPYDFTIGVEDGRGGFDTQSFTVEVLPELRGSIQGLLFDDLNGDGLQDGDEPGLSGWHVFIDSNGNGFADPHERQATTDAQGSYRFDRLLPGNYPLRVSPVAGYASQPLQHVSVTANAVNVNDLAIEQLSLGQIRGQLLSEDDSAIAHWRVFADLDGNGVLDEHEPVAISDRDGNFALTGLDAGTYQIRPDLPAGWSDVAGRDGLTVALAADQIVSDNDFVLRPTNTSVTSGARFVTMPTTTIEARQTFRYASVAVGLFGQAISYDLSLAPDGMTVDPMTGLVAWRPTIGQVGEHLVILRATDASGSIALHDFGLKVTAPNTAPVLSVPPPTTAYVGLTYAIDLIAQDAESHTTGFSILNGPGTATLDASTGQLRWAPTIGDVGNISFSIELRDELNGTSVVDFVVEVVDEQPATSPFVITLPRTRVGLGQNYLAQVRGTDALDRPLVWSLHSGPNGMQVASNGSLRWTPGNADLGEQAIELQATDVDGATEVVEFTLQVLGRPVNSVPQITSVPLNSAVIGGDYQYDVEFADADSDPLDFALLEAPVGMSIHPSLGTVRWTPAVDQRGEIEITIRVTDPDGQSADQTLKLNVSRFGGPPVIRSTPPTEASVGTGYLYPVAATDAEGDPLTYRLLAAPDGMGIVESTGVISWAPTLAQVGQQDVVIEVSDGVGGAVTQAFAIRVAEGVPNLPPQITSQAPRFAVVGAAYEYQFEAIDPEATTISYSLGLAPAGMTIDPAIGLVSWTPTSEQTGQFVVTLIATDAGGANAVESFRLDVLAENRPPVISSTAPTELMAGVTFAYQVVATDLDLDPLTYSLVAAPAGASIDVFGKISWPTAGLSLGSHDFSVEVSDPRGGQATQSFTVTLVPDTEAPRLSLIEVPSDGSRNVLPWQGPFVVYVRAIDNVEVASLTLTANGQDIPLSAAGTATFTFEDWKFQRINATATAIDTSGNVTTRTIGFDYDFPEGWSGAGADDVPTAVITSPSDAAAVFGMVSIRGTADHEDFAAYKLSYRRVDEPTYTEFLQSDQPVTDGELGVWDTSLLINDEYLIRLEVATNSGVVNVVEHGVGLAGELKLGNFRLSFTDMVIPVAGIPIEITRIYDTLQADREGDFGYGWRLEYRNTDLRVGLPSSGLEEIGIYSPLRPGVKVFLNVPGQGRQGFTFNPDIRVLPGFGGNNLVLARPRFTPDPGVTSKLSTGTNSYLQVNEYGELFAPGGIPYNPASPEFGGAYVLMTRGGMTYRVDGATGLLTSASDANGNRITFAEQGIGTNNGTEVDVRRDRQGRVTAIVDPNGSEMRYEYSSAGDLVAVTDREGARVEYEYVPSAMHILAAVNDPMGRGATRYEYDDSGRLIAVVSPNGARTELSADLGALTQTVLDSDGNPTTVVFDDFGRIVRHIDSEGGVTATEFDRFGFESAITDPLGNRREFINDASGNLLVERNASGEAISRTYDAGNRILSETNALGQTRLSTYDDRGNLTSETDVDGSSLHFEHDARGNLTAETDALGHVKTYENDVRGNRVRETDALGVITEFAYRTDNLLSSKTTYQTTPSGVQSVLVAYEYDRQGRRVAVIDAAGNATRFEHDAFGFVTAEIEPGGNRTEFDFDARGILVEQRDPDGSKLVKQLDSLGNTTRRTFDGMTFHYEHDSLGRLTTVIYPDHTPQDLSDNPREQYVYDLAGRLIAEIDANGARTEFEYDAADRLIVERDALGNETRFRYDAVGRIVSVTDSLGRAVRRVYEDGDRTHTTVLPDGARLIDQFDARGQKIISRDPLGAETRFRFDASGRLVEVTDTAGFVTQYAYDELGNRVSQTDALGRATTMEYDQLSQLVAKTLPLGQRSEYRYNALGQLFEHTDFNGATIGYEYDSMGRVVRETGEGQASVYAYDERGLLKSFTDAAGETRFQYDVRNRLIERSDPGSATIRYEYDAVGNRIAITSPGGTTTYSYDLLNRITTVGHDDAILMAYAYDQVGNLVLSQHSNGVAESRVYDSLNRNIETTHTLGGVVVESFQAVYDLTGRVVSTLDLDGRAVNYSYDAGYRLIREEIFDGNDTTRVLEYTWDSVGNRIQSSDSQQGHVHYAYDLNDRLLEETSGSGLIAYDYDANGNLVAETKSPTDRREYSWDARGRLVGVMIMEEGGSTEIAYRYDLNGMRVAQSRDGVETKFAVDSTAEYDTTIAESDAEGLVRAHVFGNGIVATVQEDGVFRYHADASGTIRGVTNVGGALVNSYRYDAFGNVLDEQVAVDLPFLYRGEYRDGDLGWDYLRARFYQPMQGRFASQDPFEGFLATPTSLHRYAYAAQDPVNGRDPTGMWTLSDTVSTVGQVASLLAGLTLGGFAEPTYERTKILVGSVVDIDGPTPYFIPAGRSGKYQVAVGQKTYLHDVFIVGRKTWMVLEFLVGGRAGISGATVEIVTPRDTRLLSEQRSGFERLIDKFNKQDKKFQIQSAGGVIGIEG